MTTLSLLGRCGLAVCWIAATALATPVPHPTREGRLVDERDGLRVEYSPGQEAYAEAVFAPLAAWRQEFAEKEAEILAKEPAVLPGSAKDLIAHRDDILATVAKEIGLPAPTALQGRVFDTMLNYYEMMAAIAEMMSMAVAPYIGYCNEIQIWNRAELVQRLGAGETIENFSYDPVSGDAEFKFGIELPLVGDQKAEERKFDQQRLDHSFNYSTRADGVVEFAASFTMNKDGKSQSLGLATRDRRWELLGENANRRILALESRMFPITLTEKQDGKTPGEVVIESVAGLRDMVARSNTIEGYRNPVLAHMILHEVAEVGIVENFIGSADRRWFCDGAANYVAWKIVRDRCGAEFARQSYDIASQLTRYGRLQRQIDLKQWRAAENTKEEENGTPLMKAHYAFASRAVFEMVRQHGEAFLPALFQEVAKTPRAKVRMATVEKAYRKLTGKKLDDVIKFAEKTPVAGGK